MNQLPRQHRPGSRPRCCRQPLALRPCDGSTSSTRTSPAPATAKDECAGQGWSPTPKLPTPGTRPAPLPNDSRAPSRRRFQLSRYPLHSSQAAQHWCTGKDSNLRTSLGGADLQSAGFNHSPTCAETGFNFTLRSAASRTETRCRVRAQLKVNRRPEMRAHIFWRANTTLGNSSLWSALGNPAMPPRLVRNPFPGAGEGIRTPDPLITNQMLYHLSYASSSRSCPASRHTRTDPFLVSGTTI